jgi:hypothetical protein
VAQVPLAEENESMSRKKDNSSELMLSNLLFPQMNHGSPRFTRGRWAAVAATTAVVFGGGGWVARSTWADWINMKCIQKNLGICSNGLFAEMFLQHPPKEVPSSLTKKQTVSGTAVSGLGRYSLMDGGIVAIQLPGKSSDGSVVQKDAYGVSVSFSYDPDQFRKAFGTTFIDKNKKTYTISNEAIAKQTIQNYTDYLRTDTSSEKETHQQACVEDMRRVVDEALLHSGWLLRESSSEAGRPPAITAESFAKAENGYTVKPYLDIPDDPERLDVYAGYVKPGTSGKPATFAIIDCASSGKQ